MGEFNYLDRLVRFQNTIITEVQKATEEVQQAANNVQGALDEASNNSPECADFRQDKDVFAEAKLQFLYCLQGVHCSLYVTAEGP